MRTATALILIIMCVPIIASSGEFVESFDYADGLLPGDWTWTGDPRGGGEFLVQSGEFVHMDGSHVHYFRNSDVHGMGIYEFDAMDSYWGVAWRITPDDPNAGRCLGFYHNDYWGGWTFSFTEFTWTTLSGYGDGQFMYHNGSNLDIVHYSTASELDGWHHYQIEDMGDRVRITMDYDELLFDEEIEPIPSGYIGLGADTGSGVLTPAFDNVQYHYASPVESRSWSSIKALYRARD